MTKVEEMKLCDAVRACTAELRAYGRPYKTRELREMLKARFPGHVARAMDWLLDDALSRYSTRLEKNTRPTTSDQQELFLPAEIAHLRLPDVITLPGEGDDDEVRVPFHSATYEQLDAHIELLMTNIKRCQGRLKTMREFRAYLATRLVGEQRLESFESVLRHLREQEDGISE